MTTMKHKRSRYTQINQVSQKTQESNSENVTVSAEAKVQKNKDNECSGVCSLSWKPVAVAR